MKCPLCSSEIKYGNKEMLVDHLYSKHSHLEKSEFIANKIFKIHKKIESLQNRIDALKKDNRFDQYVATQLEILEGKQQELKSLLEEMKPKKLRNINEVPIEEIDQMLAELRKKKKENEK